MTVSEAAVLLGSDRSTLYKAIGDDRFPLPVVRLNRQILIPRSALERLLDGQIGYDLEERSSEADYCPNCGTSIESLPSSASRSRATCSAARRSSSAIPSV